MNETTNDALDTTPTPAKAAKSTKKTKPVKKVDADAKKPGKVKIIKPAAKTNGSKPAKPAKKGDKPAKADKAPKPKKEASDVSTQQPEDSVVLKAVGKLKEPTMASKFAADLGVHRRVIRVQLQRLAKEKANGVGMKKDGPHWIVSNKK